VDTKAALESLAAQALGVLLDFVGEHFETSALSEGDLEICHQCQQVAASESMTPLGCRDFDSYVARENT
jgi:hypothetical protein